MRLMNYFFLNVFLAVKDISCQTRGNAVVPSGFSCDFDSSYCGWSNDTLAEFTWTKNSGRTPSGNTGPPWDHTTQNPHQGSYLYIETTSPRQIGDRARIKSPLITESGVYCLSFWHHMHGVDVRDLNVYLKTRSSTRMTTLLHLTGPWSTEKTLRLQSARNNEDWWNRQWIEFAVTLPSEVIFEGVKGKSHLGDIAIDDVLLTPDTCPNISIDCDFQNNTCGWSQMSGDQFNWLPKKRKTPTKKTGPTTDHTLGNADGQYLYIETSFPRNEGDKARLISPPIRCIRNATPMFRFWYHMYGSAMGNIRVFFVENETSNRRAAWERGGDQGHDWLLGEVAVPARFVRNSRKFHIIIEGERLDFHGDAAIDDVSLTGCTSSNGMGMMQSTNAPEVTTASLKGRSTNISINMMALFNSSLFGLLSCNFDNQTTCGWSFTTGHFRWRLNRGMTKSSNTGPRFDHTSTSGWYIYTEASTPAAWGDEGILRSPTIPFATQLCLTFYYHMRGSTMGTLEVLTAPSTSNRFIPRWNISGEQSVNDTDWKRIRLDISEPFNYDIIIRATKGSDFYSDIAVDDITASPSSCYGNFTFPPPATNTTIPLPHPITPSVPPDFLRVNCTFDDFTFCQWRQVRNDDFNFRISVNGNTPTKNTGPDEDHTGGGQFAYIESSPPRILNDKARLRSPNFTINTSACLSLWYHMHGANIGSLVVYQLNPLNETGTVEWIKTELWKNKGPMGNTWRHLQVTLIGQGETRLMIEAVRGDSWLGDIAIDDITLNEGECPIFNCTFQTGLCGWKQEKRLDNFDWTRTRHATPTQNTGPKYDHTYGGSNIGYFLYIETSNPRIPNDRAVLTSPVVLPIGNRRKCLQFWYHSYGDDIGELKVFKKNVDDRRTLLGSPLWIEAENEEDRWVLAKVDIYDSQSYQIIFEGVRGTSYYGDIAIDDVTISDGECSVCCGDDVFRCGNNLCVPASKRCDGVEDCGDGSDESFCGECGQVAFPPRTSSEYGTIISLANRDNQTQAAGNFSSGSVNPGSRQVVEITPDQLRLIKFPNFIDSTTNQASSEDGFAFYRRHQKVEIIRVRRRRDTTFFERSDSGAASNFGHEQRRYKAKTKTFDNPENLNGHEIPREIPDWQWQYLKKSLQRDQSDRKSEGFLDRMKRQIMLRIVGGNQAIENSWPWQGVYYIANSTTNQRFYCGATLIAPYWALTVAHCVERGDEHLLVFGEHDLSEIEGTEQTIQVETIYVNEDYTSSSGLFGDIALIRLKYPPRTSKAVQPACLLDAQEPRFPPGFVCATTGWGRTNRNENGVQFVLRQAEVPILPLATCRNAFIPPVYDSMICAGGRGSNTCGGDSGGPLVCLRNNTAYLVGLTSFGDPKCHPNVPGLYTRIQSYLSWMQPIMQKADTHYCSTVS